MPIAVELRGGHPLPWPLPRKAVEGKSCGSVGLLGKATRQHVCGAL
jgi:hypothetical protein